MLASQTTFPPPQHPEQCPCTVLKHTVATLALHITYKRTMWAQNNCSKSIGLPCYSVGRGSLQTSLMAHYCHRLALSFHCNQTNANWRWLQVGKVRCCYLSSGGLKWTLYFRKTKCSSDVLHRGSLTSQGICTAPVVFQIQTTLFPPPNFKWFPSGKGVDWLAHWRGGNLSFVFKTPVLKLFWHT